MTTLYDIPHLTHEQLADEMLTPLRDFGRSDERLFETHAFCPVGGYHRDSEPIDTANHDAVMERLQAIDADSVEEGSCSHWAVGWTRPIIIRVIREDGTLNTPILAEVQKIAAELASYPILDEDRWSEAESEAEQEEWENWARHELVTQVHHMLDNYDETDDDFARAQVLSILWCDPAFDNHESAERLRSILQDETGDYPEAPGSGSSHWPIESWTDAMTLDHIRRATLKQEA